MVPYVVSNTPRRAYTIFLIDDTQVMDTFEAFSHYARGAATLFFILLTIRIFTMRHYSRIMRPLLVALLWLTLINLKDAVLLFAHLKNLPHIGALLTIIDLTNVSMVSPFFISATRPCTNTWRYMYLGVIPQAALVVLYALDPSNAIIYAALVLAAVLAIITITMVLVYTARRQHFLTNHYSNTEHLNVHWVSVAAVICFFITFLYFVTSAIDTWLSDAINNIGTIILWSILISYAERHHVLYIVSSDKAAALSSNLQKAEEIYIKDDPPATARVVIDKDMAQNLGERFDHAMATDKLYLKPALTLDDICRAIGTNKSYLSCYLNNYKGATFYDYINELRIQEACRIIDEMKQRGQKPSMASVATACGFSSQAAFNRCFRRVAHMTPGAYYKL